MRVGQRRSASSRRCCSGSSAAKPAWPVVLGDRLGVVADLVPRRGRLVRVEPGLLEQGRGCTGGRCRRPRWAAPKILPSASWPAASTFGLNFVGVGQGRRPRPLMSASWPCSISDLPSVNGIVKTSGSVPPASFAANVGPVHSYSWDVDVDVRVRVLELRRPGPRRRRTPTARCPACRLTTRDRHLLRGGARAPAAAGAGLAAPGALGAVDAAGCMRRPADRRRADRGERSARTWTSSRLLSSLRSRWCAVDLPQLVSRRPPLAVGVGAVRGAARPWRRLGRWPSDTSALASSTPAWRRQRDGRRSRGS